MTVQIDTTAENNALRLINQGTHPSSIWRLPVW